VLVLRCPVFSYGCKQKRVKKEDMEVDEKKEEEEEGLVEFPLTFFLFSCLKRLSASYFDGILYEVRCE